MARAPLRVSSHAARCATRSSPIDIPCGCGNLVNSKKARMRAALTPALKRRAADLAAGGKASELVDRLLKGADVIRSSGDMYLTWARHYAALGDNRAEEAEETSHLP